MKWIQKPQKRRISLNKTEKKRLNRIMVVIGIYSLKCSRSTRISPGKRPIHLNQPGDSHSATPADNNIAPTSISNLCVGKSALGSIKIIR
jgi:hypothetical protein